MKVKITGEAVDAGGTPSLRRWLATLLRPPEEILYPGQHSRDFNGSRAEYIYLRQRLLSWVFAILALIWIPVDALSLEPEVFRPILLLRLLFAGTFLALALWTGGPMSIGLARARMAAFVLVPGAFFIASLSILGAEIEQIGPAMGYGFLPFVMLATLAVFPLTVLESLFYLLGVGLVFLLGRALGGVLLSPSTLHDAWLLGLLAGMALWVQVAQIHMLLRLYREATRDALTGLVNRRVLARWLDVELARREQSDAPLSVMLFDLDLFKRINDTHGHLAGDRVLRAFAALLAQSCGEHGRLAGRYGGEEFLVILPGEDAGRARELAERIRAACEEVVLLGSGGEALRFTTSVGVAEHRRGESTEEFLSRVDGGLYSAKEAGRNLVVTMA